MLFFMGVGILCCFFGYFIATGIHERSHNDLLIKHKHATDKMHSLFHQRSICIKALKFYGEDTQLFDNKEHHRNNDALIKSKMILLHEDNGLIARNALKGIV